jgi:hypothetical protein
MQPNQTTAFLQTVGVLGEISNIALPPVTETMTLSTATAGNIFGRVFTTTDGLNAAVGGTDAFAGVLINPQAQVGGALTSNTSYTVPQYSDATLVKFTSGIWVEVDTPVLGGGVQFNNDGSGASLGTLKAWVVGAAAATHYTALTNARIERIGSTITGNVKLCEVSILGAQ